ncbi:MAG: glycosyltransferase family 39 protein [Candidatus Edwardsbacteria bacterium]|jgi:hypothetical protein|nr:glycosyltransferase family 39 protein [Candidatus Edwardsbacteria bacterium]
MGRRRKTSPPPDPAPGPGAAAWHTRHPRLALGAVLASFAVLSLLMFDPKPFVGGDNAAYVALSRSLAGGTGFSEIWTPQGGPHTQYPFGFPLLLAPFSLAGAPYAWYKLIPWLSGLLVLAALWLLLAAGHRAAGALAVLLLAVNPLFLEYSHWVLSELPFLLSALVTFLVLRRWEERGGHGWLAALVLSAAWTNYVRSAGIALYAGIFAYLLIRRRYREAGAFIAGCVALTLPWALRNAHYGTSGGYLEQFLMRDPYQPELGHLGVGGLAVRFSSNLKMYAMQVVPRMLFPAADRWGLSGVLPLVALLTAAPAAAALVARLARSPAGFDLFAAAYLAMAMLWPEAWCDARLLLPLLPLLLFYLVSAYGFALALLSRGRGRRPAAAAALSLLLAANLAAAWPGVTGGLSVRREFARDRFAGYDPVWRSFFAAAGWVGRNAPPQAVVVSRKPSLFHLESGRRSYCYPFTADRDSVLGAVSRADYVMVEPVSGTTQRYLVPAVQPLLETRFKVVYAAGDPPTFVLQVLKEPDDEKK